MNKVCLINKKNASYPKGLEIFESNDVSRMIDEGFKLLGLDDEHYGTPEWNPLEEYVKPGNKVLIKPNMVLHKNNGGGGNDCLYTHPSLVAAVIRYIMVSLKGNGEVIIGDAPVQDCVFDTLVKESGYDKLVDYYKKKGLNIKLIDFRNVKSVEYGKVRKLQETVKNDGVLVRLDDMSAFSDLEEERQKGFRITNYDPRIMREHHFGRKHEYLVAKEVLEADVIINMPKPKTHRKAGVTISLKNMVGINASKEYLPHHTIGSLDEDGDAYLNENIYLRRANEILDLKNELINENEMEIAAKADELYYMLKEKNKDERFWEGSWYGNDTIWRTIVDLNYLVKYADCNGMIQNEPQRKMFIIGDMIISGEKEGPLEPSPIMTGTIAMGEDPVLFDVAICSVMGFNYKHIPSITMKGKEKQKKRISDNDDISIISNEETWNLKSIEQIRETASFEFVPSGGWADKLGDKRKDKIIHQIKKQGNEVYIFGAGEKGRAFADEFIEKNIDITAFVDNDRDKVDSFLYRGIRCITPIEMNKEIPVFLGVSDIYKTEILEQIKKMDLVVLNY